MKEIGGYIELDTYRLPMLHEQALLLNCARSALAYLIRARGIKKLYIPKLVCYVVPGVCERESVPYELYSVGEDFLPACDFKLGEGEWLYLVNLYGQIANEKIAKYVQKYNRVIVDNAHSYFQPPLPSVDTLYTCRKFFGVSDGAILYTDAVLNETFPVDESFERMHFVLGRLERTASEFYGEFTANDELFDTEPIKLMSKLTRNLLHGIDYAAAEKTRRENFDDLHERLGGMNRLRPTTGTYMYPFWIENGAEIRKKLLEKKIYIPTLWPNVLDWCREDEREYDMAKNILPLPIDQRYGREDMEYVVEEMEACMSI